MNNSNIIKKRNHSVDIFFVLLLFLFFALLLLGMLFFGARVYRNISLEADNNYELRTSLLYATNKVRAYDGDNAVYAGEFAGSDAIIIEERYNDVIYVTRIYEYNGNLMELFSEQGNDLEPVAGTPITNISDFKVRELNDNLIEITVQTDKSTKSAVINTH